MALARHIGSKIARKHKERASSFKCPDGLSHNFKPQKLFDIFQSCLFFLFFLLCTQAYLVVLLLASKSVKHKRAQFQRRFASANKINDKLTNFLKGTWNLVSPKVATYKVQICFLHQWLGINYHFSDLSITNSSTLQRVGNGTVCSISCLLSCLFLFFLFFFPSFSTFWILDLRFLSLQAENWIAVWMGQTFSGWFLLMLFCRNWGKCRTCAATNKRAA